MTLTKGEDGMKDQYFCGDMNNHNIQVRNLDDGEEVSFSLLLLRGAVITKNLSICPYQYDNTLTIQNFDGPITTPPTTLWPIINQEFKCMLNLKLGINRFLLMYCSSRLNIKVVFKPKRTSLSVIPVYIVCKGHDGRFQSPDSEDNSIQSACERISTGMRLIQTLIAEKLFEMGHGRKSFQLQNDLNNDVPECEVFYSNLPVEQACQMAPPVLWEHFARELMTSNLGSKSKKYVALLSCTRYTGQPPDHLPTTYEQVVALTEAHVALGGGGLALFGSACLHTWPCSVEEVLPRFLCTTPIDKSLYMDDSYYRGTYGACFSTTLGSVCHELCHVFDLGHTSDGIMGQDYNNLHLVFTVPETHNERLPAKLQVSSLSQLETLTVLDSLIPMFEETKVSIDRCGASSTSKSSNQENKTYLASNINKNAKYNAKKSHEDQTFWSDSSSTLLAYHRWLNPDPPLELKNSLTYNKDRNVLSSPLGIRAVELRDSNGTVHNSWCFLELHYYHHLNLRALKLQPGSYIVAIDSAGNLLKYTLGGQ